MPTALIVEDEPDANTLLSMLVRLRGYRSESALGGAEGLRLVERCRPDVVLLDLMLPDLDGFEVCRSIKAGRETTLIPVIVVSAARAPENEPLSYSAGANDFVRKPYTPDQIFRALENAEAWRRDVCRPPTEGTIPLDTRDPLGPLRELSRLRSILRAWTPLDEEVIAGIGSALLEFWTAAEAWGRDHDARRVAEIRFRLESDRLTLCLEDRAGWLVDSLMARDDGPSRSLLDRSFDAVVPDPDSTRLELIRHHPPGAPEDPCR